MIKLKLLLLLLIAVFTLSCTDDQPDFGHYYKGKLVHKMEFVSIHDSLTIITHQPFNIWRNDTIPGLNFIDKQPSDTISLILHIAYGSYKEKPIIHQELSIKNDTAFIWYSNHQKLFKSGYSINAPATSPRAEIVVIDSVEIFRGTNKTIDWINVWQF